jgi:hypothetical protein
VAATTKTLATSGNEPSIQEMVTMVARLGGYPNRKHDPNPGATVIWRGLTYLSAFADAFELFSKSSNEDFGVFVKNTCG